MSNDFNIWYFRSRVCMFGENGGGFFLMIKAKSKYNNLKFYIRIVSNLQLNRIATSLTLPHSHSNVFFFMFYFPKVALQISQNDNTIFFAKLQTMHGISQCHWFDVQQICIDIQQLLI